MQKKYIVIYSPLDINNLILQWLDMESATYNLFPIAFTQVYRGAVSHKYYNNNLIKLTLTNTWASTEGGPETIVHLDLLVIGV